MTTYIDFRYSRALAMAMFTGHEREELAFEFSMDRDRYLAFGLVNHSPTGLLAGWMDDQGQTQLTLERLETQALVLKSAEGRILLEIPFAWENAKNYSVLALKIGPQHIGIKVGQQRVEKTLAQPLPPLHLQLQEHDALFVMGQGTGRAWSWGELFYRRQEPTGLTVELSLDWHHLRAGIPLFGTMTAEMLIQEGKYRLKFRSYAYDREEAEISDFMRLFHSESPTDIAVHLSPPLYAHQVPGVVNLAFFVVEFTELQQDIIDRCNRMDALFVPSHFVAEALQKNGCRCPIHVIPHGVDLEDFKPTERKEPLPGGKGFNFLAIGTHVERKNFKHLVRAFLEEFREDEDVSLFLMLRPEYHTSQNNIALDFTEWERRYARKSAQIYLGTGYLARATLRKFYANADAYVMPSVEGFGLTLMEAMASGTPTIGLNHGGVLDFLNSQNGYLVPTGKSTLCRDIDTLPYVGDRFFEPNRRQLRKTLRRVFEKREEAQHKAAQARRDLEARFSWEKVTAELSKLIEKTWQKTKIRPQIPQASPLSWALCILDNPPVKTWLSRLKKQLPVGDKALCLFTRYAEIEDVLHARRHGFMFYRWDGSIDNCRGIAHSVLGRGWVGVLKPGEKLSGPLSALREHLDLLPIAIMEVSVNCNGQNESRFFRLGRSPQMSIKNRPHFYSEVSISP